jgi:hypothetical protein
MPVIISTARVDSISERLKMRFHRIPHPDWPQHLNPVCHRLIEEQSHQLHSESLNVMCSLYVSPFQTLVLPSSVLVLTTPILP